MPKQSITKDIRRKPVGLLLDTCVWLDLAKDHNQHPLLAALGDLAKAGEIEIVVPQIVRDEFESNKRKIIEEARRSFSSALRRARDAVDKYGSPKRKGKALTDIDEVVRRVENLADDATEGVAMVLGLFKGAALAKTTDAIKL